MHQLLAMWMIFSCWAKTVSCCKKRCPVQKIGQVVFHEPKHRPREASHACWNHSQTLEAGLRKIASSVHVQIPGVVVHSDGNNTVIL